MEINHNKIIISNIDNYNITFHNGNMILINKTINNKPKINIDNYDFKNSKIINCIINNEKLDISKYRTLLNYIYKIINNTDCIINNTILNISKDIINNRGYTYNEDLKLSVQGADSNKVIKEIINMINLSNINYDIKIKLENDNIINI